jgi:RHS repeat-associated protein
VGSYGYHATRKHAVVSAGSNSYTYDANGNMATRNGATLTWTSDNLPASLSASGYTASFNYAPDRSRWRQVSTYAGATETTIYVGGLLEKLTSSVRVHWKHRIPTPSGEVQMIRRSDGTTDTFYVTTDHLGSTEAVMDASGTVLARESFGSWGARRGSNWATNTPPDWAGIANTTRRGYTGHEHLDNILLVHMNGRVYDPAIGRFLSADPYVTGIDASQGWNRYAYVTNNPLAYTDPSGYFERGDSLRSLVMAVDPRNTAPSGGLPIGGSGLEEIIVTATHFYPPTSDSLLQLVPHYGVVRAGSTEGGGGTGGDGDAGKKPPQSQDQLKDWLCSLPAISYGLQLQFDLGLGGLGWQASFGASFTTHGQFLFQAQGGGMFGLHAGAAISLSPQVGAIGVDPQRGWSDQSVVVAQAILVEGPLSAGYALQAGGGNGQVGVEHGRVRIGPSLSAGALVSASGGRQDGKQYASAGMCGQGGGG